MLDHVFEKTARITLFRFNVAGHEIIISNNILVIWIIMAVLITLAIIFTRNMSMDKPGKLQILAEWLVQTINGLCKSSMGHHWKAFAPYIGTLMLFLGFANITAVFNFIPGLHLYPPAKDINVAAALAAMSIILVFYATFRYKGVKGWLKSLVDPMPIMAPFKLMEYATKPLSLCLRLFGNILAAFLIMESIYAFVPIFAAPFSAFFDLFDGVLQAFIFVYLTSLYIGEAVE